MDRISVTKRKKLMSRVKNKNTDIELILRQKLCGLGYKYRVNYKIFGKPDIAFLSRKIAIFCDGDFWHGKNFKLEKANYKKFWQEKILKNIERDKEVKNRLESKGWIVLRFWKSDILKNSDKCVAEIIGVLDRH